MKKNFFLLPATLFVSLNFYGQSQADIKKIIANYDIAKLNKMEAFYRKKAHEEKEKAVAVAKTKKWPIYTIKDDGSITELMRLSPEGLPIYYSTNNVDAAKSTRTNHLNTGGSLGLNLNGQGMTVRVWDGGNVRTTHNAFGGRVTIGDDASNPANIFHATHVTGTMIASANPANIKGMAFQANARTFNWTDDASEAISEAIGGMLISNHSYGVPVTNNGVTVPSWFIGAYSSEAAAWDNITYEAPYFLPVMSAGNDGQNNNNPEPLSFGYDKLTSDKTAKNSLIVANCQDVTTATNGTVVLSNILINQSSSQGPTDDLRIKPDITGNGTGLTSTGNANNSATGSSSGTSMSSPNVAGTLILLQQHNKNITNSFMRSATLKGIACHTADDAGEIGPDPVFGWGLLNAKKAVETITNNGLSSWISEENLNNNEVYTMTVNSNGTAPLMATISWTDLPGVANNGTLGANDPTPALVNDLDIRITRNGNTYYPWKLTTDIESPAIRTEDNAVDNIEQIKIDNPPAGQYIITVTNKGALVTGTQNYSLIVTGLSSAFALNSNSDNLTVCSTQNAVYTFNYTQTGSGTTTFSAVDLPAGATASFSPASLGSNGVVTMTISGLSNSTPNEYFVGIKGTSATDTETRYKSLRLYNGNFQQVALQNPSNGQQALSTTTQLKWTSQLNAQNYTVQVSLNPEFSSFIFNEVTTENEYTLDGLSQATRYYWRIIPSNFCGNGIASNAVVYSFATGTLACNNTFTATDFSNNVIAEVPNSEATVPVTVTGGYTIGDLKVNMNITHTWIGDIRVTLEGPASIGSPIIILLDIPCGDFQNINCIMDDAGDAPACSGNPAILGAIAPVDSLSSLNTLPADGEWILRVFDFNNEDGGTINSFSIDICNVQNALSVGTNPIINSSVYPNPTTGNVAITSKDAITEVIVYNVQGQLLYKQKMNELSTNVDISQFVSGTYFFKLIIKEREVNFKILKN